MSKTLVLKRLGFFMLALSFMIMAFDCGFLPNGSATYEVSAADNYSYKAYSGTYSSVNGTLVGIDDTGRSLPYDYQAGALNNSKYVGIFYFLWQGEHGTAGPYDNTKIVLNNPSAIQSESNWLAAGGGALNAHHFWGEPLFGYYKSNDEWVMRKHVQMLTDAGVDFIFIDATNAFHYPARSKQLIKVWYEYYDQGYKVPKIVYYTNSNSGATINNIYNDIYNNSSLKSQYPNLDGLWFKLDGKPLIIGDKSDSAISSAAKSYFRIKASQWPTESAKSDGFPWMEFGRYLSSSSIYTGTNGEKVMNVSVAQHNATVEMSRAAWYGGTDRTRSYHNGSRDTAADAYLYGYNFAQGFEYAIRNNPTMITITGWNEWVAQRQPVISSSSPIRFVDCANYEASRDIEPAKGYYGDNYYMEMVNYIRQYKGAAKRVNPGSDVTIDVTGDFSQWNNSAITAKYTDYTNDIVDRDTKGFGNISYVNKTGRNDFKTMKVCKDSTNFYFYAETVNDITSYNSTSWMTLFISTGSPNCTKWYGYDYAVNLETPKSATKAYLSKCTGGSAWSNSGTVNMKVEGNKIMIAIPRSKLEATGSLFDIQFKWADNYQPNDFYSFYTDGDTAPYGRLNYLFSNSERTGSGDITQPVVRDIKVSVGSSSATISMYVSDNTGIKEVYFPTWTEQNTSPNWLKGTITNTLQGKKATVTVKKSDFANSTGLYTTHIYVTETSGKQYIVGGRSYSFESNKPTISDVQIYDVNENGYSIKCKVTDDSGIDRVNFPSWCDADADNKLWYEGVVIGNMAYCRVNIKDFANKTGSYTTHIYAYDLCGNSVGYNAGSTVVSAVKYDVKIEAPSAAAGSASNAAVTGKTVSYDKDSVSSFTLKGFALHSKGVSGFRYEIDGTKVTMTAVDRNDLSSAYGSTYSDFTTCGFEQTISLGSISAGSHTVKVYATPKSGNTFLVTEFTLKITDLKPPVISDVRYYNVTATGYDVSCTVTDNSGTVKEVKFPTWTTKNGQDDLASPWPVGTLSGNTATFRVSVGDHNLESGEYNTHIYAYDNAGNNVCYEIKVNVPAFSAPADSFLPVYGFNLAANTATSTVWTADKGSAFTAVYWGVLKLTPVEGGYKVVENYPSGSSKSVTVSGSDILICVAEQSAAEFAAYTQIAVNDVLVCEGIDVPKRLLLTGGGFSLPDSFALKDGSAYTLKNGVVTSKQASQTAAQFSAQFKCEVSILKNGAVLSDTDTVGTGCRVVQYDSDGTTERNSAVVVILCDTDGDGKVTANDHTVVKAAFKSPSFTLKNEFAKAADADRNGRFTTTDYLMIKRVVQGNYTVG